MENINFGDTDSTSTHLLHKQFKLLKRHTVLKQHSSSFGSTHAPEQCYNA